MASASVVGCASTGSTMTSLELYTASTWPGGSGAPRGTPAEGLEAVGGVDKGASSFPVGGLWGSEVGKEGVGLIWLGPLPWAGYVLTSQCWVKKIMSNSLVKEGFILAHSMRRHAVHQVREAQKHDHDVGPSHSLWSQVQKQCQHSLI